MWFRIGNCKQCGDCCKFDTVWRNNYYSWSLNKGNKFTEETQFIKCRLDRCCPSCDKRNKRCKIHSKKPQIGICSEFPLSPDQQIICSDDCGYSFFWIEVEMPVLI